MYSEIRKVDHGNMLDIKIVGYFIADANEVDENELYKALVDINYNLDKMFKNKMKEKGYFVSNNKEIKKRLLKTGETLSEFLLKRTDVGDFIKIVDNGWYVGCTIIDGEDIFIKSLNSNILKRKVLNADYGTTTIGNIEVATIVVEI